MFNVYAILPVTLTKNNPSQSISQVEKYRVGKSRLQTGEQKHSSPREVVSSKELTIYHFIHTPVKEDVE